jgi:hypothetical protein
MADQSDYSAICIRVGVGITIDKPMCELCEFVAILLIRDVVDNKMGSNARCLGLKVGG